MSKKGKLGAFVAGAGLGVGLGLLFAPASGDETRKELGSKARSLPCTKSPSQTSRNCRSWP